jgi:predicted nucleic acid-binding Zn ribbon protein
MSKELNPAQLINQDSGDTEHYTPVPIVEAARLVMGGIDLDPASSAIANETVRATEYYTKEMNGLKRRWYGRVWMNHPYSSADNKKWPWRLWDDYSHHHIEQACMICFASTSENWFRIFYNYPICFISKRVQHIKDGVKVGKSPTKGSCVVYFGPNVERFYKYFNGPIQGSEYIGYVMVPFKYQVLGTKYCDVCGDPFVPKRTDALYCSGACNQKAKRERAKQAKASPRLCAT